VARKVQKFTACLAENAAQQVGAAKDVKTACVQTLTAVYIRECQLPFSPKSCVFIDSNILDHNFAFLLYGSEAWSVPLREEDRLMVFENTVLKGVFAFKRAQVTGDRRR
jgi:hypothetical protein